MKKHLIWSAATLLLAVFSFSACKKDDKGGSANNNGAAFKNTTWTGEFNYAGKGTEPATIEFIEGGQLVWRELLAAHTGSWTLAGDQLQIGLDGSPAFKGTVSGNTLTNIQSTDMNGRNLKNASLNTDAIPELDNTVWQGSDVSLKFKPGGVVDMWFGAPSGPARYPDMPYIRSGRAIHFNPLPDYNWFVVITSPSLIKGTNHAPGDPTVYHFLVTKQ